MCERYLDTYTFTPSNPSSHSACTFLVSDAHTRINLNDLLNNDGIKAIHHNTFFQLLYISSLNK